MEEDEDVILEGTSLHEHLKNVGFTDYEVISSHNKTTSMMKDMCPVKSDQDKKYDGSGIFSCLMKKITAIIRWTALEKWMLDSMSLKVTQAKVLEEEDLLILETLSPAMKSLSSLLLQDQNSSIEEFQLSFIPCVLPNLFVWLASSALLFMMNFVCGMCFIHYLFLLFFVGAIVAIVAVIVVFIRLVIINKYKDNLQKFDRLIKIIQNSNQLSWKCFRFLNEINLIRKGIGPKYTEIDLLECSYEKSLYESLLSLLNSLTRHLQKAQYQLRQLDLENAQSIHSLFRRRYEDLSLQDNSDGDDVFVICKNKRNEMSFLSSSFLTEFLLCFELCEKLSLFKIISFENLKSIQKQIESLEKILNLSKKVWLRKEPDLKAITNPPKSYERLKLDVSGAVDFLSIKCKVLAYSCVQLEELVRNYESQMDKVCFDAVQQSCEDIKNKILSCNASLEDVVERTENRFDVPSRDLKINVESNENMEEDSTINSSEESKTVVVPNNNQPPVIEDEVFEAVADHKYHSLEEDIMMFESLKKEKRLKKKQKERCKRVLQEIQPILQERRKMWEEREANAINKRKRKQNEISPSEISCSGDSGINSPADGFVPHLKGNENEYPLISQLTANSDLKLNKPNMQKDASCSQRDCDGEYDSEEERLLLYRKVKKELDEDEARRKNEDDYDDSEEEDYERECLVNRKSSFTLPLKTLADKSYINTSVLTHNIFNNGDICENDDVSLSSHCSENDDDTKKSLSNVESRLPISAISINADKIDFLTGVKQESPGNVDIVDSSSGGILHNSPKNIPDTDYFASGINSVFNPASSNLPGDDKYSCGESSDEYDKVLDWSSCGFERRRLRDEDDEGKVMPFSGVPTLLSMALQRTAQVGEEEVFGGVGEGESDEISTSEDEMQPS